MGKEKRRISLTLHPKQMQVYLDNHRFRVVVAGRRWGKCLSLSSVVSMADGTEKKAKDLVVGDEIVCLNPNTYLLEIKKVKAIENNGIKPIYKISTNAHSVLVTDNHPFLQGNEWVEVKDLKVGSLVGTPKSLPFGNFSMPDEDIVLLATWLAEGCRYQISNATPEIIQEVSNACALKGMWLLNDREDGVSWTVYYGERRADKTLNPLKLLMDKYSLWDCRSKTKFIPDDIFRLNRRQLARFLNLFVACDGCITSRGKVFELEIGLANERMIKQLQSLFLKFGIRGQVRYKKHKAKSSVTGENFESWTFRVSESKSLQKFCEEIGALSKEEAVFKALQACLKSSGTCNEYLPISYEDFLPHATYDVDSHRVGKYGGYNCKFERGVDPVFREIMKNWRKQSTNRISVKRYEQLRSYSDGYFDPLIDGDVAWEEIKSIEYVGEKETIDLEVEDHHNFIANGFITHNSFLSRMEMIAHATKPNQKIWYVAPTYRMAKQIMWGDLLDALPKDWISRLNETNMTVELVNGSRIELKGADKPDSLRGVGLNGLILDEYQDMREETWTQVLRPTLADKKGWALFIGCVAPTTKILTKRGVQTISSLSKGSPDKVLDPCDLDVYGLNHEFHKADGFWNNGIVPTKEITTKFGFYLEGSYPHPIYTINGWKKIEDIKVGDRVAIARGMEVWGNEDVLAGWDEHYKEWKSKQRKTRWDALKPEFKPVMNEDLAYFLGLWLAEGSIEEKVFRLTITCGDGREIGDFLTSGKVCGLKFKPSSKRTDQWRANSKDFVELMRFLGMPLTVAPRKHIPEFVWRLPRNLALQFISGMIDGDGHVTKGEGKRSIGYSTSSGMLARDFQLLLTNIGVVANKNFLITMPTEKARTVSQEFQLNITGDDVLILKQNLKLKIDRKRETLEAYPDSIRSKRDGYPALELLIALKARATGVKKKILAQALTASRLGSDTAFETLRTILEESIELFDTEEYQAIKKIVDDGYYWDTVEEIRESERRTYDFTIPDTHSFWSNGFISHNTPKSYNCLYKVFKLGQPGGPKDWMSWQFPTSTSPFIPYAELEAAKKDMDEKSYRQEFESSFETMAGRVYYPFSRAVHIKSCPFNPKLPVWIGMDFNIDPMSSVILQPQANGELWAVGEIVKIASNTEEMASAIEQKYYRWQDRITLYPDPAGGARQHARGETDIDILREHGFSRIKYRRQHPAIADRVNSVNRMLMSAEGKIRLFVDPSCTHLINALEQTLYIEGSREVDKSANIEHSADALGYAIEIEYPIRKLNVAGYSR